MTLTDKTIRAAKPRAKPYVIGDGDGLSLEVQPDGALYWRFRYRFAGKREKMTLGVYKRDGSGITLAIARKERAKCLVKIAHGINPKLDKVRRKAAPEELAFATVADEWFKDMVPQKGRDEGTIDRERNNVDKLKAIFARRAIASITLNDILAVLTDLDNEEKFETRVRMQSTMRRLFGFAAAKGYIPGNPAASVPLVKHFTPPANKPRAAITDPVAFGEFLRAMDTYRRDPATRLALKLHPLVFVRPGELMAAEWVNVDLDRREFRVPFEQVKMRRERAKQGKPLEPHRVPLSRQAVAILRELHAITGAGRFLFPHHRRGTARSMPRDTLNNAIRSLGFAKEAHCAHGTRATAKTLLGAERQENGWPMFHEDFVELQMDHLTKDRIARIYDRGDCWPDRARLMQHWADMLDTMRGGGGAKVITLMPGVAGRNGA